MEKRNDGTLTSPVRPRKNDGVPLGNTRTNPSPNNNVVQKHVVLHALHDRNDIPTMDRVPKHEKRILHKTRNATRNRREC